MGGSLGFGRGGTIGLLGERSRAALREATGVLARTCPQEDEARSKQPPRGLEEPQAERKEGASGQPPSRLSFRAPCPSLHRHSLGRHSSQVTGFLVPHVGLRGRPG